MRVQKIKATKRVHAISAEAEVAAAATDGGQKDFRCG